MTGEQMAIAAKYEQINDWTETMRMLHDSRFRAWAEELAYEEHAAWLDTLDQAAIEHGLG